MPLADNVYYDAAYFRGLFAISENGVLIYAAGAPAEKPRLFQLDRAGKQSGEPIGEPSGYRSLGFAPDGQRFAASIEDPVTGTPDIWIFDTRGVRTRFTFGGEADGPVWSYDGSRIAYSKLEKGQTVVYVKPASGGGQESMLFRGDRRATPDDWSRDGRYLLVDLAPTGGKTKTDVWVVPVTGKEKPGPFLATEFDERAASFSPDGKWVSYVSDESGRTELYVAPFPGPGGKWQVSTDGSSGGGWFKDGKEILYGTLDNAAMSVDVNMGPSGPEFGAPKTLFKVPLNAVAVAITPDGERFLVAHPPGNAEAAKVALVTNWTAGLTK